MSNIIILLRVITDYKIPEIFVSGIFNFFKKNWDARKFFKFQMNHANFISICIKKTNFQKKYF